MLILLTSICLGLLDYTQHQLLLILEYAADWLQVQNHRVRGIRRWPLLGLVSNQHLHEGGGRAVAPAPSGPFSRHLASRSVKQGRRTTRHL